MEDLTTIFCLIDDFCKQYKIINQKLVSNGSKKRNRKFQMFPSEIATILVYFHLSKYRNFKHFYLQRIIGSKEFPKAVSYNRFVELMKYAFIILILFQIEYSKNKCTGISFIDSTILKVCDNRRIHSHKVMKDYAKVGKSSTGWFYGLKLHLVINHRGEILSFFITSANVDDRNSNVVRHLTEGIFGKLYGDRGYISQKLFEELYERGIQLITKIRNNMKSKLLNMRDKILLRKRGIIESVNDELKNMCQIQHTRHRSSKNYFVNLISGLVAYSFFPKKPSLNIEQNLISIS